MHAQTHWISTPFNAIALHHHHISLLIDQMWFMHTFGMNLIKFELKETIYSKLATVSLKCPPSLNDLRRHNISWRPFLQCFLGQEVNIISNDCPLLSARPKIIFFEPSCYRVVPHSQPITRIKVGWHPFTGSKGNYFASFINHQL